MKQDAIDALNLKAPKKIPSKETVNNYELLINTSGIDPYVDIESSYIETIRRLGIDYIIGVPGETPVRMEKGETRAEKIGNVKHAVAYLGVFPTIFTLDYGFNTIEQVLEYEPEVSNPIDQRKLNDSYLKSYQRSSRLAGEEALVYPWFYDTLFMWCVNTFGWEMFLTAAMSDEDSFDCLLEKFKNQSIKHIAAMDAVGTDFIMVHDDLCMATGPIFRPEWYHKHIFPRYTEIFEPIMKKGKKVIFTSDGNIDVLLDDLVEAGFDGFMIETPATDFDNILKKYGKDKIIIGGIDTRILTFGSPSEVYEHTREILTKGKNYPGFFISSPGGIHGNIPYANLQSYFSAKEKYGYRY